MNKFTKTLNNSHKEIKAQRANMLAEEAQEAQSDLISDLKKELRSYKSELMTLEDLSPDAAFSFKPMKDGFNASEWVREIQRLKIATANKEIEIDIAEKTFAEWFGSEE